MSFATQALGRDADAIAPDGSEVRLLARLAGGSLAHFTLRPGQVSKAVAHKTVEEIWYVLSGRGRMWRALDGREEETELYAGLALTLPRGTRFQFRCDGAEPLAAVGITLPPWPGAGEAFEVTGPWRATV